MKGKILITFFVALFLLTIIPYASVKATSTIYLQNFTSQINNQDINKALDPNGHLSSLRSTGTNFKITSASYRGAGGLSFAVGVSSNTKGNITFDYSKTLYLTNFSLWFNMVGSVSAGAYFIFYNKTIGISNYIVELSFGLNTGDIYYYENFGSKALINNVYSTGWMETGFNIDSNIGECSYYYWHYNHINGYVNNATLINLGYRIDRIYIGLNSQFTSFSIDDFNYTLSTSYTGGIFSGCSDFTGNTPTGRFAYGSTDVDSIHISTKYNVPVSTTVTGVELQISTTQYDADSVLANYGCSINGIALGRKSVV